MQMAFPEVKLEVLIAGDMQTDELIDILQSSDPILEFSIIHGH